MSSMYMEQGAASFTTYSKGETPSMGVNVGLRAIQFVLSMVAMAVLASTSKDKESGDVDSGVISFTKIDALSFLLAILAFIFIWSFIALVIGIVKVCGSSPEFGRGLLWTHFILDLIFGLLLYAAASAGAGTTLLLSRGINGQYQVCDLGYGTFCQKAEVAVAFGFLCAFTIFFTLAFFAKAVLRR